MTMGKMTALALGLLGGFALGVWTGPHITHTAPGPSLMFRGVAQYGFELQVPVRWQGAQI